MVDSCCMLIQFSGGGAMSEFGDSMGPEGSQEEQLETIEEREKLASGEKSL